MTTFALDTSTPSPSLALVHDDGTSATLRLDASPNAGRRVMLAAHGLFVSTGIDVRDVTRVVVGVGPGAFTGVRIGISTALGLSQALGCPVDGVVSPEAASLGIADVAPEGAILVPVGDARRGEVFAAAYRRVNGHLQSLLEPCAITPEALGAWLGAQCARLTAVAVAAGNGSQLVAPHLPSSATIAPDGSPAHSIDARHLVQRAEAGAAVPARPVYARLPDAEVNRLKALEASP